MHHLPVALILIVEAELYANLNRLDSEEADSHLAVDHPLHKLAVRVTAVIQEPALIALVGGVDDLQKTPRLSVTWRVRLSARRSGMKKHKKRGELQGIFTRCGVKNMKYMCCCLAFSILACEKDEAGGFRAGKYVCSVRCGTVNELDQPLLSTLCRVRGSCRLTLCRRSNSGSSKISPTYSPTKSPLSALPCALQHVPVSSRRSTGQNTGPEHRARARNKHRYVQTATRVMASFAEMRCNDEVAETMDPHAGYSRLERRGRTETIALLPGIEDLGLGVLVTLEPLVATPLASAAVRAALDLHHPVETLVIAAAH